MTWWDAAFLAAAGVVGGLTGSVAGLASVATYPALLVVGLPPVTANVTNTVALVSTVSARCSPRDPSSRARALG